MLMMKGKILQINVGSGGVPKKPIEKARATKERLEGDDWGWSRYKIDPKTEKPGGHGGPEQAICIYSFECLEKLKRQGFEVFPGALGENFTTKDLDYRLVRIGDIYQVGLEAQIRITWVRSPCGTIGRAYGKKIANAMWDADIKRADVTSEKWGMTGFYAAVQKEGLVCRDDTIERIFEGSAETKTFGLKDP